MLKNYILVTLRSLWKNRVFSFINIIGLTLGISVCLIIYFYVEDQTSYDNFHNHTDRTYRMLRVGDLNGEKYLIGVSSGPFAEALANDFSEDIERTTRVLVASGLVTMQDKNFIEEKVAFADSNFLQTFNYPLAKGSPTTVLQLPNSVIITQKIAEKYFGDDDPMNKTITFDGSMDFIVTGVFDQFPAKSHLDFDFVANFETLRSKGFMMDWWSNGLNTYVVLKDGVDRQQLESQFPAFMDKYFGDDFTRMQNRTDIALQPLKDVYFQYDVRYDYVLHGNKQVVYIFSIIGLFIFIIACINFMNLATAKSTQRAKEVGVRKALGSTKFQLSAQFFMESICIATLAVFFAFMITEVSLPLFNSTFSLDLQSNQSVPYLIGLATTVIVITGLFSGAYPALVLSSFKPIQVLKGKAVGKSGGINLRKSLVVLQFSISIVLIIFTLVIRGQMEHLSNLDLGFEKDEIILVEMDYNTINKSIESFQNALVGNTAIRQASLASGFPGGFHDTYALKVEGMEEQPRLRTCFADENYLEVYDIDMVAGRYFSKVYPSDKNSALIINVKAAEALGWSPEEAIGKRARLSFSDSTYREIIGVVDNYYFSSVKTNVEPLVMQMADWPSLLSVRVASGTSMNEAIELIESEWAKYVPFEARYRFLDDTLNNLYENEQLQAKLFQFFALISIVIASLGIFGLASFSAHQRKKEIGVRKALGASVQNISNLLAKDYVKLVLISNLVAWPVAYYLATLWLAEFVERYQLSLTVFIIAMIAALAIAVFSVIFQSLKAARTNPAHVLKEE